MLKGLEKLYTGTLGDPEEVWAELNTIPHSLGRWVEIQQQQEKSPECQADLSTQTTGVPF
jgi:hypothetical protein